MTKHGASHQLACGLLLGLISLLVTSCRPASTARSAGSVILPDRLTDPRDQRAYLVAHYWDHLLLHSDPTSQELRVQTEDYCDFIVGLSPEAVRPSLHRALEGLAPSALREVLPIYKERLYTAGSPSYDEALYGEVLQWVASSSKLDTLTRSTAVVELARLRHNAPGRITQDFRYHERDSLSHRLRDFAAPYTLLMLVRDSSQQLQQWGRELRRYPTLEKQISAGSLRPLVIYTGTSRPDSLSRTYLPSATTWGYDSAGLIASQRRYAIQQGSGLYLLNQEKRVLLKNTTLPEVNQTLQHDEE